MTKNNITRTMKIYSILAFLTTGLLFQACSGNDCSRFKSGNFVYHIKGQGDDFSFFINRNDSIQTEVNSKTGDISKVKVTWIDDCNYELRFLESTAIYVEPILSLRKNSVLKNEIVSSTNDYYIFKTTQDNSEIIFTDTLWIMK